LKAGGKQRMKAIWRYIPGDRNLDEEMMNKERKT
jgi:hypothetical protein